MALKDGILWVNDGGVWKGDGAVHPYGRDASAWQEPWETWATDGTDWYAGWPYLPPANLPPPQNLRITAVTSSSVTVAWDAPVGRTPFRYLVFITGQNPADTTGLSQTFGNLAAATNYVVTISAIYPDGNGAATLNVTTGSVVPPSVSAFIQSTYSQMYFTTNGTAPFTLRCVGGARNGQTFSWPTVGNNVITGLSGREFWQVENTGGTSARWYTDAGTPAQSGVTGAVKNTLANPLPVFVRGGAAGIDWGVPAMAAHANFPYVNCTDGTGASRWQTGNYPKGWVQHQIGIPDNYRVRRFMFAQGDGAGNTETVCPVYSVDGGASFKRWSHGVGGWIAWDTGGTTPGAESGGNSLLGISPQGSWDRDWNWRLTDNAPLTTPFIPENGTDLSQRYIYVRWGLVHLGGSFGANIGEVWMEYQEPSTPGRAEVLATAAWG